MIPDNIISTTEGQEQTTIPTPENTQRQEQTAIPTTENTHYYYTTTDLQLTCPTNDYQYQWIGGKCVYFETKQLTYDEAIQNCQEKLKDYGAGIGKVENCPLLNFVPPGQP